ncbi:nickel-responsive transcriptional regulator NikR [Phenylobacterium sp.]|uniref:nickel-responsive transcriptional regulator NikR n=1 Tax=Phenylobacterium sp. TaxID=1871053 RepID=UPI0012108DD2|nr:nickel-responsive transcriptional regulator NikR [Phenylobacterium sp.]THD63888.1 MAG: nickel-responsive transcriptional regulator NikR [Phenylobacterium sp.]
MQRVTISIDETLGEEFDALIADQGYQSRSEAVRDLVRHAVEGRRLDHQEDGFCVASLSYVYDHETRDLAQRLVEIQHDHHDLVVATMHVHLDHGSCLETTVLRGPTAGVRSLADTVQAERGVRFANVNLVSIKPNDGRDAEHIHHRHRHGRHASPNRG